MSSRLPRVLLRDISRRRRPSWPGWPCTRRAASGSGRGRTLRHTRNERARLETARDVLGGVGRCSTTRTLVKGLVLALGHGDERGAWGDLGCEEGRAGGDALRLRHARGRAGRQRREGVNRRGGERNSDGEAFVKHRVLRGGALGVGGQRALHGWSDGWLVGWWTWKNTQASSKHLDQQARGEAPTVSPAAMRFSFELAVDLCPALCPSAVLQQIAPARARPRVAAARF